MANSHPPEETFRGRSHLARSMKSHAGDYVRVRIKYSSGCDGGDFDGFLVGADDTQVWVKDTSRARTYPLQFAGVGEAIYLMESGGMPFYKNHEACRAYGIGNGVVVEKEVRKHVLSSGIISSF